MSKFYAKKLSAHQLVKGMKICIKNAEKLIEGAEILYEKRNYRSASSLAVLSIEQIGNAGLIKVILSEPKPKKVHWMVFWKLFEESHHKERLIGALFSNFLYSEALSGREYPDVQKEKFVLTFEKEAEKFNKIKKSAFYVKFDKQKNTFNIKSFKSTDAKNLILQARELIRNEKELNLDYKTLLEVAKIRKLIIEEQRKDKIY